MADGNFRFKVNGFDSYTLLLGEELRGERATLGKSLLQVQKDLKIKAAYISAIENCDLDDLKTAFKIVGYFLENHVLEGLGLKAFPAARARFVDVLSQNI